MFIVVPDISSIEGKPLSCLDDLNTRCGECFSLIQNIPIPLKVSINLKAVNIRQLIQAIDDQIVSAADRSCRSVIQGPVRITAVIETVLAEKSTL